MIKRHLTVLDQRTVDSKDSRIEQLKAENALLLAQLEKERRGAAALEEAMVEPSLGMRSKDGVTAVGSLFGSSSSSSSSPLSDGVLEEGPEAGLRVFSSSMPTKLAVRDIYVSSGVAMYKMPYLMTATGWNTIKLLRENQMLHEVEGREVTLEDIARVVPSNMSRVLTKVGSIPT